MSSGNQDRLRGAGNELKGKAKRIAGEVADDEQLKGEGTVDKLKGKAQKALGDAKDAVIRTVKKV